METTILIQKLTALANALLMIYWLWIATSYNGTDKSYLQENCCSEYNEVDYETSLNNFMNLDSLHF